jgi:hypothetical protein
VPLRDINNNLVALSLGGTNTFRLTSAGSQGSTEANVNFFMLVPPLTLKGVLSGGNINLSFLTQTGFSYQIQYKNDLSDANWSNLGNAVAGDGTTKSVSDPTAGKRFYRLQVQ